MPTKTIKIAALLSSTLALNIALAHETVAPAKPVMGSILSLTVRPSCTCNRKADTRRSSK